MLTHRINRLRAIVGGILDIVLVAGPFNMTNRLLLGLGRDQHPGMDAAAERLGSVRGYTWL